jgi:hypothetical protein
VKRQASNRRLRIAQVDATCACGKTTYASKPDADKAAVIARRRSGDPINAYHCHSGGGWHIGHAMERRTA